MKLHQRKIAQILNLRKQGKSYKDISLATGVCVNRVMKVIKEYANKNA